MPHRQWLRDISSREQHTLCSCKIFEWQVWDCASHSCSIFLSTPKLFCKASGVIREPTYFSVLFLNNFPFVYAYSNLPTVCVQEEWGFSLLFYTVTKLSKPRQTHAIGRGPFYSTFGCSSPRETWIKIPHWYFNWPGWPTFMHKIVYWSFIDMLMKDYKIATYPLKHITCPHYALNDIMTRLHSCVRPSFNTHPGFSERNANQILMKLSPSPKLSISELSRS